jgi:hypothetical protein
MQPLNDTLWESQLETVFQAVLHGTTLLPFKSKQRVLNHVLDWCTQNLVRPGHPHDAETIQKVFQYWSAKKQD